MQHIASIVLLFVTLDFTHGLFVCPRDGMFENIVDRNSFWHCANGQAFLKRCGTTLVWSPVYQVCVWDTLMTIPTDATTIVTVTVPTTTAPINLPVQCYDYVSITDSTRHATNTVLGQDTDGQLFSSEQRWVRFEGAAGTRLANYSVANNHCGSATTGWVKQTVEPSLGETADQTVCLNWTQFTCIWPKKVPMTNCGSFVVYALSAPAIPEARYCTI